MHIDKAAASEHIDLTQKLRSEQQLPLDTLQFWINLHYLRNNLIHHFDQNMLHSFQLQTDERFTLFKICKNAGQIVFYLQLVMRNQTTAIDLRGQKFKVFLDIYELADLLATHNSREIRIQITQPQYLQAMTDAIGIIFREISPNVIVGKPLISTLCEERYYALQNILECIATLGNPNMFGAVQLINDSSRRAIFSVASQADGWLRGLGQSRIMALHEQVTGVIPDDKIYAHLENLRLLHQALLEPALGAAVGENLVDRFGISAPIGTPSIVGSKH